MRYLILIGLTTIVVASWFQAASIDRVGKALREAAKIDLDEESFDDLTREYDVYLKPHAEAIVFFNQLKGIDCEPFPLSSLKEKNYYRDLIHSLTGSANVYHRTLAYMTIAAANDTIYIDSLLTDLADETEDMALTWGYAGLLHLGCDRTTQMFDATLNLPSDVLPHIIPKLIKCDPDSLRNTALAKIGDNNKQARILSLSLLSSVEHTPEADVAMRQAVSSWPIDEKGYAIQALMTVGAGDLLPILSPLLSDSLTREISLLALSSSPTPADREYVMSADIAAGSSVEEQLDRLFISNQLESVRRGMEIIASDQVPEDYFIWIEDDAVIRSDDLHQDLLATIRSVSVPKLKYQLVRYLAGRTDSASTGLLVENLRNDDHSVRYWSAEALKGNPSELIKDAAIQLIKDEHKRTSALCSILLEHEVDTLQTVFELIFEQTRDGRITGRSRLDWERTAIDYLSAYPRPKHRSIFVGLLEDQDTDFFIKQDAALGLGRLKDTLSVPLIVDVLVEESQGSDLNSRSFLIALSYIGDNLSREVVELALKSEEEAVRQLAEELLDSWQE